MRPLRSPRSLRPLHSLTVLAAFSLLLAGCTTNPSDAAAPDASSPSHPLLGTLEPGDLTAPGFDLLGTLGRGGPAYGAGEPSIAAAPDGTLYVAFPGCDRSFYLAGPIVPGDEDCQHGLIFRSTDAGATWLRLNRDGDGRYEDGDEAPAANGDAEVAVDAAGAVYASNLGGGIQMHRSDDQGLTWHFIGNVVEEGEASDRQWIAASGPGHLIVAWMGSGADADGQAQARAVIVNSTFDGGANWTGSLALGSNIGWLGPVAFAPDGQTAYLPFTQVEDAGVGAVVYAVGKTFSVRVAKTADGGRTWDVLDTGARITGNAQGGHWSGVNMAPALDVTGDGTVVAAWSEDVNAPLALTAQGAVVKATQSRDGGATWATPVALTTAPVAIMPWVVGGAGDRFALTYFAGSLAGDPDYLGGSWDVRALVADCLSCTVVDALVQADVHQGGICSRGGTCQLTGSDRALLDFFEADVTPDGRIVLAYPADPLTGGKFIDVRVALQSSGTPLLVRGPQG